LSTVKVCSHNCIKLVEYSQCVLYAACTDSEKVVQGHVNDSIDVGRDHRVIDFADVSHLWTLNSCWLLFVNGLPGYFRVC